MIFNSEAGPNLIILNRQNTENFKQPLSAVRDIHVEAEFLMFTRLKDVPPSCNATFTDAVFGIWFFDSKELEKLFPLLMDLTQRQSLNKQGLTLLEHLRNAKRRRSDETASFNEIFDALDRNFGADIELAVFKKEFLSRIMVYFIPKLLQIAV